MFCGKKIQTLEQTPGIKWNLFSPEILISKADLQARVAVLYHFVCSIWDEPRSAVSVVELQSSEGAVPLHAKLSSDTNCKLKWGDLKWPSLQGLTELTESTNPRGYGVLQRKATY